jgi:hypothetical protein
LQQVFHLDQYKIYRLYLTKVLRQLGLDGSTIGSFAKPNFSSGRTNNFELQILTSTKIFQSSAVPGGRNTNIPTASILDR